MLTISKKVEGLQTGEAFNMLVRFYDAQGNELTEAFAYTGDVTGTIASGGKIALKHGQSVTISGMPDGTKYTVEEEVSKAYSTTVNGDYATKAEGLLTGSNNRVDFVNTMETTTFSVTKIWEGADLGTIILTLYADGVVMEPQPEYIKIDDVYRYSKLPKYNADGELIVYAAKEKGIEGYIRIYDNVAPYEDVTKFVHNGGTIINRPEKKVSFQIRKVWTGLEDGETTPDITLTLYCNGEKIDMPTPTPDSKGWSKYYNLPTTHKGEAAVYTVLEDSLTGFTTRYELENGEAAELGVNGGTIINAKIPQTGDEAPLALWIGMMGMSGALLLMLQRRKRAF